MCVGMKRITHGSACLFHVSLQSIVSRLLWVSLPAVIERSKTKKDTQLYKRNINATIGIRGTRQKSCFISLYLLVVFYFLKIKM